MVNLSCYACMLKLCGVLQIVSSSSTDVELYPTPPTTHCTGRHSVYICISSTLFEGSNKVSNFQP